MLIPTHVLRAVSLAMAKNDIRYYLNGMLIEATGSTARLVATDGHRLNIADFDLLEPIPAAAGQEGPAVSAIVPRALIDWAIKQAGRRVATVDLAVIPSPPDAESKPTVPHITVTVAGTTSTQRAVDGRFPDYAWVIPHELSGELAQYNPRYVLDAYNACSEYLEMKKDKEHATALCMNGTGHGVMAVGKFAAVIMPWRAVETDIDPCLLRPVGMPEPAVEPASAVPLPPGWEAEQAAVDYANACGEATA